MLIQVFKSKENFGVLHILDETNNLNFMQTNTPNPELEKKLLDQLQSLDVSEVEKALSVINDQSFVSQKIIQKLYKLLDDKRLGSRVEDGTLSVDRLAFKNLEKISKFKLLTDRTLSLDLCKSELKAFLHKKYPYLTEHKQTTEGASPTSSKVVSETTAKSLLPGEGNLNESSSTSPSNESKEISSKKLSKETSQALIYAEQKTEKSYFSTSEKALSSTPWLLVIVLILLVSSVLWFFLNKRFIK